MNQFPGLLFRYFRLRLFIAATFLSFAFFSAGLSTGKLLQAQSRTPQRVSLKEQRRKMVAEYLAKEGIKDKRILTVMNRVPRHEFVTRAQFKYSYHDTALPIGHKQTISPPFIVAYMTQILEPKATDKVLEIGTGSGYQAAVLSGLVKEVYSIEIVKPLGVRAKKTLKKLGYKNVTTKVGDGYKGWKEHAPFDKIIVTCSPESIPTPLTDQLKEGGRMIIPIGKRYQQVFVLLEKKNGKLVRTKLLPTLFVPMTGQSEKERIIQPQPTNPRVINGGFEIDKNSDGFVDGWHYQRRATIQKEDAPEGKRFLEFKNEIAGRNAHILQGMAIDGRKVDAIQVTLNVRLSEVEAGTKKYEKPGVIIHFYDNLRNPVYSHVSKEWEKSERWEKKTITMKVPTKARNLIIQAGLNGAVGTLGLDDIVLKRRLR